MSKIDADRSIMSQQVHYLFTTVHISISHNCIFLKFKLTLFAYVEKEEER